MKIGVSLLVMVLFFSNANGEEKDIVLGGWENAIKEVEEAVERLKQGKDKDMFDKWGNLKVPPGMVRLSYSRGMQHGGYYDKYFTVHEISVKVFEATSTWTPSSLDPIPLPVHQAYTIYSEWQKTQPGYRGIIREFESDRIELSNHSRNTKGESNQAKDSRWFYTFTHNGFHIRQSVIVLLDGTLVPPRVVDLRTESEKKEYEERVRNRFH